MVEELLDIFCLHFVEIWNFGDVNQVNHGKVLTFFGYAVQHFVHLHAGGIPIVAKTNHLQIINNEKVKTKTNNFYLPQFDPPLIKLLDPLATRCGDAPACKT